MFTPSKKAQNKPDLPLKGTVMAAHQYQALVRSKDVTAEASKTGSLENLKRNEQATVE
jgi:hypothetical protein